MNNNTLESFVNFCNDMMIAEEGMITKIKDTINGISKSSKTQKNDESSIEFETSDGKTRKIWYQDKYKKDADARKTITEYVKKQVEMVIKNEKTLVNLVYKKTDDILNPEYKDKDYFDMFFVYEGETDNSIPSIDAYVHYNQLFIKDIKNGKATLKDVNYQD